MTSADHAATARINLLVEDLGRLSYSSGLEIQRQRQAAVINQRSSDDAVRAGVSSMYLLFVEHDPPVITVSRRPGARDHLLASPAHLRAIGIEIAETDRGGDITYHGPGQLVVYPILDLNLLSLRLHSYMRLLEDVVINLLAHFNIRGEHDSSATGVWVRNPHDDQLRKICAMGVRISRWVSMHGLALNVTTNLDHFRMIVPCGLIGRDVTSLERELGPDACPSM
ncbi:MAG: lipoyl(octanoyl) transferase LipB, partial [Phycisphaerales bacterium]